MEQILKQIPDISLIDLNNLLTEYPLFMGLKVIDNNVYGIVAEIETKQVVLRWE